MEVVMNESEARERGNQWAASHGNNDLFSDPGMHADKLLDNVWIFTPSGRGNALFIVTDEVIRAVNPSLENIHTVLAQLNIEIN